MPQDDRLGVQSQHVMVRLDDKDLWLGFPDLLDGFVWRFEAASFELLGKVAATGQSRACLHSSMIEA